MASEDLAMVAAVVGCRVNGVGPGVDPVNSLHGQVEGQTVGPCSVPVRRHNEDDLASVSIAGHVARFDSNLSKIVNLKDGPGLGGSPGLVVMGGDSSPEGRGFESQHHILDGHFSHILVVKIVMFVWKDENK